MKAALALLRSSFRGRRWSVALLAIVVGVVVGFVTAGVGGAIRTSTAVERMDRRAHTSDLVVAGLSPDLSADPSRGEELGRKLAGVDGVEAVRVASGYPVDAVSGDYFQVYVPPDGSLFSDSDRPLLQRGRLPAPSAADEIAINETAVRLMGIDVGDVVEGGTIARGASESMFSTGEFPGFTGPRMRLRVVGVVRLPSDLSDRTATAGIQSIGSPAFVAAYGDRVDSFVTYAYLDVADTSQELVDRVVVAAGRQVGDYEVDVSTTDELWRGDLRNTLHTIALIILAVTGLAAVAALLVAFQWIRREVLVGTASDADLRALGMTRWERTVAGAGTAILAVVTGSVLGVAGGVVASAAFPLGVGRPVEVDPGLRLEPLGVLAGVIVAVALVGIAVAAGRRATSVERGERPAPGRVARRLSRWGLSAPTAIGAELALEPGRGRRAIPTRSAILGAVVAVAGVSAVLGVGSSADAVIDQPERFGWTWTALPDALAEDPAALFSAAAAVEGVAGLGNLSFGTVVLDGHSAPAMSLDVVSGRIRLNVVDGRVPVSDDEVAVSLAKANRDDARIGDTISLDPPEGSGPMTKKIVGVVIGPPIDGVARELLLTPAAIGELGHGVGEYNVVRFDPGSDAASLQARLTELGFRFTPSTFPQAPGEVTQFQSLRTVFLSATALVVLLGAAGLVHVLAISTRRRRRDLALLRALGFERRDVRRTLSTQAVVTALVGVGVGVPLGIVTARFAWRLTVRHLGIVDTVPLPLPEFVLIAVTALLGAVVLSLPLAREVSRRSISGVLRAE